MTVLTVENLSKNYGNIRALVDVSFSVPRGSVFGILGPNGSGKTTLLGLIMDILQPSSGSYRLFDEAPSATLRKQIGTFLETPNFYHYLSAIQNLRISAAIKGRGSNDIDRVLEMVNLSQRKNSAFSTFSLGMKQRLAIASCLLGNPEVLVLDEPTNGLDPVGIAEIRELIKKLQREGKTIIMASHLLDEVEKVCSHVAILKKGELVATGPVNEILATDDIVEAGATDLTNLEKIAKGMQGCTLARIENNIVLMSFATNTANLASINQQFFEKGIVLNHLAMRRKSLESKFIELTN